jgi:serine/threonine protein kinase/WD40 repeat protein
MGDRDDLRGRTLGEFIVRERIGEGGFGAVYRCEQPLLGREAVVKVLHHGLRNSEVVLQRFMREAQLASRLKHPYAAHIYAFAVEKEDGLFWIAMEFVDGIGLDKWLRERGKLEVDQLVPLFERVAEVVQTAHERGIVHRDLKPSNIMVIERAGRLLPMLLDFGIAKAFDATAPAPLVAKAAEPVDRRVVGEAATLSVSRPPPPSEVATLPPTSVAAKDHGPALTQANAALGSPPYMSPEQWLDPQSVGPSADLYALGIVAYEALAGRRPFAATTLAGLADLHCNGAVPPLDDGAPPALDVFFRRALAKRPADRPATALELAAELRIAAGLAMAPVDLPKLDDGVRDVWLAEGPQPIAEAIAAVDGARNVHQGRDAARELFRTMLRYVVAIALASRAQVRGDRDDPALHELLRALRRRDLDDNERVRLLRLLVRPFESRRGAHPVPELVDAVGAFDDILELHPTADAGGGEAYVRSQLPQLVAQLTRLLRAMTFVLDYSLVVARDAVAERWMGLRRQRRALATIRDTALEPLRPVLIDRDGRVAVLLWPLVQVIAPATGVELEPFVFDGRGRHGARLISAPAGFEHHDPDVWEWLGEHVIGDVDPGADAPTDERAPFLGLASFAESDADRFVGREREIDAFSNRLRQRPLQIVVGASGAGKSSFVHAGILPSLPVGWRAMSIRPGTAPLGNLAARLGSAGVSAADLRPLLEASPAAATTLVTHAAGDGAIVIVVDQLEELFTLCRDPAEREQFAAVIAQLTTAAESRVRVICTVRDDFLMDVESLVALRAALSPSLYLLGNPSRDDLVRTVVEPARRAGYELSDATLANDMVDAVADQPGALALLSFTASRLWELRDRRFRQLTRKAYDAMGGVGGALGQHAEDTLATLAADEQRLVQIAFRHLVTSDETRAVLSVAELRQRLASARADAVIDKLVAARLLAVGDEGRIEIIHEALIGAWPRLQQWVREDSEGARMREQLRAAAKQWHERGRARGLLWRDEILMELERARSREDLRLSDDELAFANASRRDAARSRRIRRAAAVIAFVAVATFGVFQFRAASETRTARDLAETRLTTSYVEQGRRALLDGAMRRSVEPLWLARASHPDTPFDVDFMLARSLAPFRGEIARMHIAAEKLLSGELRPDGKALVVGGDHGVAEIWDLETATRIASLELQPDGYVFATYTPDGQVVITGGAHGVVGVWNAAGKLQARLHGPDAQIMAVAVSADSRIFATADQRGHVVLWSARAPPRELARVDAHPGAALGLAFAGDLLLSAGVGGLHAWAAADLADRGWFGGEPRKASFREVEVSANHKQAVIAGIEGPAELWDIDTRTKLATLDGERGNRNEARFSPDDMHVVTTGLGGAVHVWRSSDGDLVSTLKGGHTGFVNSIAVSADSKVVATGGIDGTIRLWDALSGIQLATFGEHAHAVQRVVFAEGSESVISLGWDGTVRVWDPSQRDVEVIATLPSFATKRHPNEVGISMAGQLVAVSTPDGLFVIDLLGKRVVLTEPVGADGAVHALATDDRVWWARDQTLWSWSAAAGRRAPIEVRSPVVDLVRRQSGGVVVVFDDGAIGLVSDRIDILDSKSKSKPVELDFSADDTLAVTRADGSISIWSLAARSERIIKNEHPLFAMAANARSWIGVSSTGIGLWSWSGEPIRWLDTPAAIVSVALHPTHMVAAWVGRDSSVSWFDAATGRQWVEDGHHGSALWASFDPEGRHLLTTATDGIGVWSGTTGRMLWRNEALGSVIRASFAPDGDVVVLNLDGTLMRARLPSIDQIGEVAAQRWACRGADVACSR